MRPEPGISALTATSTVPTGAPSFAFEVAIDPWTIPVALGLATIIAAASLLLARRIGDRRGPSEGAEPHTADDEIAATLERRAIRSARVVVDAEDVPIRAGERRPDGASR